MYVDSCSSSMIITPIFSKGANTPILAPMTILASPRLMRIHSSNLSRLVSLLWSTAMALLPNLPMNLSMICLVRAISGTSIMAVLPMDKALAMARMYISVLPLLVTPWIRKLSPRHEPMAPLISSTAAFCSTVRASICWGSPVTSLYGSFSLPALAGFPLGMNALRPSRYLMPYLWRIHVMVPTISSFNEIS